jgi:hypothetical protein
MAIYDPPCTRSMPEWLADRIRVQGLKNTGPALTVMVAATAGPDNPRSVILNGYLTKVTAAIAAAP